MAAGAAEHSVGEAESDSFDSCDEDKVHDDKDQEQGEAADDGCPSNSTPDAAPAVGAAEHGNAKTRNPRRCSFFLITISLRDDWLHRSDALQDMDLQTYAEHIERAQKPRPQR